MEDISEAANNCANCNKEFKKESKERKYGIQGNGPHKLPIFKTLSDNFPELLPLTPLKLQKQRCLCNLCANALSTAYKHFNIFKLNTHSESYLGKKKLIFPEPPEGDIEDETAPGPSPSVLPIPKIPLTPSNELKTYLDNVFNNKVRAKILYNYIRKKVNVEVKALTIDSAFGQNRVSRDEWFPEDQELDQDLKVKAPLLRKILLGAASKNQKKNQFNSKIKAIASVMVFSRNRRANAFQKMIGLTLFKGHATIKTYEVFRSMGLCVSYQTIIRALDTLNSEYDKPLVDFQAEKTQQIQRYRRKYEGNVRFESSTFPRPKKSRKLQNDDKHKSTSARHLVFEPKEFEEAELQELRSGMFSIDNINHYVKPNNYNSVKGGKMLNMTSAAFIFNRIPQPMEEALKGPEFLKAVDVPESAFIPTEADVAIFRNDQVRLIKQLLVKNVGFFKRIQNQGVTWNPRHEHSHLTCKKSEIISLGIMNIDEGTTEGTKEIMKIIEDYAPDKGDGSKLMLCCGGDTLTADNQRSTQKHLFNSDDKKELLNRTVPLPGKLHFKFALLQDELDLLLGKTNKDQKEEPCPGVGTLPYLRALYGHPSRIRRVKHNFIPAYRFVKFSLTAYVCTFACKLLGIKGEDLEDEALGDICSDDELIRILDSTAQDIVSFAWHDIRRNTEMTKFCICQEEFNSMDERPWIACDNNDCPEHYWYHVDCLRNQVRVKGVGLRFRTPPRDKDLEKSDYYCTFKCEKENQDKIALYSKAVLSNLLCLEAFRDANRYADALRIDAYCKLHLINFFNNNHPKMLRVAHLSQLHKHGYADSNARHDLMYNSTVNILGQADTNLEMDLFHEMMNHYLKEMILLPSGNSTTASIARRSKAFQILKDVSCSIEEQLEKDEEYSKTKANKKNSKKHRHYLADLKASVTQLLPLDLFEVIGKRHHEGFKHFKNPLNFLENISLYKAKLLKMAQTIDSVKVYQQEKRVTFNEDIFEGGANQSAVLDYETDHSIIASDDELEDGDQNGVIEDFGELESSDEEKSVSGGESDHGLD